MKPTIKHCAGIARFSGELYACADVAKFLACFGYELEHATAKRLWPYFWIQEYTVTMIRPCETTGKPVSVSLEDELSKAIDNENYELAAKLRDMMKT